MKQIKKRTIKKNKPLRIKKENLLLIFISLIIIGGMFIFANGWYIDFAEAENIEIEYGYNIPDPGARLKGKLFFRNGIKLNTVKEGDCDTSKDEACEIKYKASFLSLNKELDQKITVVDNTPPVITLVNEDSHIEYGINYTEEGYSAYDNKDGDLTDFVIVEEHKNEILYYVSDSAGNVAEAKRIITDTTAPDMKLNGPEEVSVRKGYKYNDQGAKAYDMKDGDISDRIRVESDVNTDKVGDYEVVYYVSDEAGNESKIVRKVKVSDEMNGEKTIYLTFDDGPCSYTRELLDVLKKYDVKATFFVVGNGNPEILKRIVDEGHSIGIHSYTHNYSEIYSSVDAYFEDLEKEAAVIENATGVRTNLLRFPGGSSNMVSAKYCTGIMSTLVEMVSDRGYYYFDWNVLSGDAGETTDTDVVYSNIIRGIENRETSVVLQHDIKYFSVSAVEDVITYCLSKGYTFAPLSSSSPTCHHGVNN
ncbi:MAG: polysaccharide deacetylase family protein [Erysipelotrichaceae bacterium]|nr:polysaccharide deacetylase family protein [Erysipelotrichaceae bacterium]